MSDDLDSMTTLCKNTRRFMHKSEEQLTGAGHEHTIDQVAAVSDSSSEWYGDISSSESNSE